MAPVRHRIVDQKPGPRDTRALPQQLIKGHRAAEVTSAGSVPVQMSQTTTATIKAQALKSQKRRKVIPVTTDLATIRRKTRGGMRENTHATMIDTAVDATNNATEAGAATNNVTNAGMTADTTADAMAREANPRLIAKTELAKVIRSRTLKKTQC